MSVQHSITYTLATGGVSVTATQSKTAGQAITLDESLSIGTDALVALTLDISQLKSLYLISTTACTIETNSGSAADDTITLAANVPLVWQDSTYHDNPFSADVTALYVTNAAATVLTGYFLVDPTV